MKDFIMPRSSSRPAPALAVLFGLSLAGCSAVGSTSDQARAPGGMFNPGNYVSSAGREAGVSSRGGAPIAALPAQAGRVVDVREKRYANGLRQEIALAGDAGVRGENVIVVTYRDQPNGAWGEPEVELPKDRDDDIAAELEARFPSGAMRVQNMLLRNAYGPYGVATGRVGAANCVYLWQSVADLKANVRVARVSPYAIETTVRVRLCRSGVGVGQLTQWASNVVIDPNGVGQPALAASEGGRVYAAADPLGDALETRQADPRGSRFAGYAAPPAAVAALDEEEPPRRARAAPTRAAPARARAATRYVRARRASPAPRVATVPQTGYVQGYAQPQSYAAPAYATPQPGQPIWIQPGAAALAQSAAPAYGGGAHAANGSVALPPQAFGGPAQRGYVAEPR